MGGNAVSYNDSGKWIPKDNANMNAMRMRAMQMMQAAGKTNNDVSIMAAPKEVSGPKEIASAYEPKEVSGPKEIAEPQEVGSKLDFNW